MMFIIFEERSQVGEQMSTLVKSTKPISNMEINASRLSIVSGALFILLVGSLHFLEPEFDPTWRFISEYALGQFGWMMTLAFVALAICLACVGLAIFSSVRNVVGYVGFVVLVLAVVGMVIAALFKTDPIFTKQEDMTFSGQMHVLGATLDFSPLAFLLLSFSLVRHEIWASAKKWLFLTATLSIALTIGFILTIPSDGVFGPGVYSGLVGRFLMLSYLFWLGVIAFQTIRIARATNT